MRGYRIALLGVFLLGSTLSQAQCECAQDKKYDKLVEQGLDRKKNDLRKRIAYLQDALELDQDCPKARFVLGELYFKRAKSSPSLSFNAAKEHLDPLKEACPNYRADLHYYLGYIAYAQQDWTGAQAHFDNFIDFPMDDPAKLGRGHERKMGDVEELMPELKFNAEVLGTPVPFNPQKLSGVSSPSDEYLPTISPDNESIYYTRKYMKKAKGDLYGREIEEFTISRRPNHKADFDEGKALPNPFNIGDNYGGATISVNNKEMYLTVCRPAPGGYTNCDIYLSRATKEADGTWSWSELENLGGGVNTKDGWEAQPSLSADGNTLYFATARETTKENPDGGKSIDIFYSHRGSDGSWGKARSLSDKINGPGNEKSPFMHGDSRTLYFSSNGLPGVGGYDIFYSKMEDNGTWTEPKNIGVPINTGDDEHGLIVSTDGHWAYYASNRVAGARGFDIFRFEVPEKARPDKVVLLRGEVKDEEGKIVDDARVQLNYIDSKKVEHIEVSGDDGSYAAIINVEQEPVVMTVEKEGHAFQAKLLTEEDAEEMLVEEELVVEEMTVDKPYTIDDINYGTNSAEIDKDSKLVLDLFADYLLRNSNLKISIHGHTDNVGGDAENLSLSTDRAFEVMSYLQSKGVPARVLSFKGFGASRPVASNTTAEGRAQNRRTEFIVTTR